MFIRPIILSILVGFANVSSTVRIILLIIAITLFFADEK